MEARCRPEAVQEISGLSERPRRLWTLTGKVATATVWSEEYSGSLDALQTTRKSRRILEEALGGAGSK